MKKKLLILSGIFLLSLGAVFVVLFTTSRVDYKSGIEKLDSLASSEDVVSSVLNAEVADYSKFDASKLENYASTVKGMKENLDALRADKVCADKYKERCDELGAIYEKLELSADSTGVIIKFTNEAKDIAGVSSDTLSEMKNSSNSYLQTLAKELAEYREAVDEFKAKYVANADDTDYVADYTKIDEKYQALKKKYSEIKSEQLFGASNEEMLSFYGKIEELKKLFAEEK